MRTRLMFTVVLAALIGIAPMALGQSTPATSSIDVPVSNQVTINQCSSAGEPVSLNGNLHADMIFSNDSSGANHFNITVSTDLNGNGQNSGMVYTASDSNAYTISTSDPAGEITVEFRSDLTPVGGGTPMTLVQTLHLMTDTGGTVSIEPKSNVTTCGS